jgi:hypothetical protein
VGGYLVTTGEIGETMLASDNPSCVGNTTPHTFEVAAAKAP